MSFSLIRTNTGLSTNAKVLVDKSYKLYLDTIESVPQLASNRYKKVAINSDIPYHSLLSNFFKNVDNDIIFAVKDDEDNMIMRDSYQDQFDETYMMSPKRTTYKYNEEYEFFAPLYIENNDIPKGFLIFRIDGSGVINSNKDNFREEILDNLKIVQSYDILNNNLYNWINMSFSKIPISSLTIDFNRDNFSYVNGIDLNGHGFVSKAMILTDMLEFEKTYMDFEKFVYDSFKNNNLVFPYVLNLSFLFDDEYMRISKDNEWKVNRYIGFYIDDYENITKLSSYGYNLLDDNVIIDNNILINPLGNDIFKEPIKDYDNIYITINNEVYKVNAYDSDQFIKDNKTRINTTFYEDLDGYINKRIFKIVSDVNYTLNDLSNVNNNIISITNNYISNLSINTSQYDLVIFTINGRKEILQYDNDLEQYYIFSDYIYNTDLSNNLIITLDNTNTTIKVKYNTIYNICGVKFTDIRDFDTKIVNTDYSKHEYEFKNGLTASDEPKMYVRSDYPGLDYREYIINNKLFNIPVSSEYLSKFELFRVQDKELGFLWKKNPCRLKFGFKNSHCAYDYSYLLNNSIDSEDYNRNPDLNSILPNRIDRNLDYFYTYYNDISKFSFTSLHSSNLFDHNRYLSLDDDYFKEYFTEVYEFDGHITTTKKYSVFNEGDVAKTNTTLFRGMECSIYNIDKVIVSNERIVNINSYLTNDFDKYKFAIIATQNSGNINSNGVYNQTYFDNDFSIFREWKIGNYVVGDLIYYGYDFYECIDNYDNIELYNNPMFLSDYFKRVENTIFWSENNVYSTNDIIVYNDKFYYKNSTGTVDIYYYKEYDQGDVVFYKGLMYQSLVSNNDKLPDDPTVIDYWRSENSIDFNVVDTPMWSEIQLFDSNVLYNINNIIIYDNIIYRSISTSQYELPINSNNWIILYSFKPNVLNTTEYRLGYNNVCIINNHYYRYNTFYGFDNGINIYINKKYKNILIEIYNNDNTLLGSIYEIREKMYDNIAIDYTANNLISSINDISLSTFMNNTKYIIYDENNINVFDINNIAKIPHILSFTTPIPLNVSNYSLKYDYNTIDKQLVSIRTSLNKDSIFTTNMINNYDNLNMYVEIKEVNIRNYIYDGSNDTYSIIYRYSGYYDPIVYGLQLFTSNRYKFATYNTNFGKVREVIISKVNQNGNLLKLRNQEIYNSIYPIIDEFGYTYYDRYIFKSPWDTNFHILCENNTVISNNNLLNIINIKDA